MLRIGATLLLLSCAIYGTLAHNNGHNGRIVNGVDTSIESHPYQVSLQNAEGKHFCGGSIYKDDIIITAAHCVNGYLFDPTEIKVRLGSTDCTSGGQLVDVADIRVHDRYNWHNYENDIALIKLAKSVSQSNRVRYIGLATQTPQTGAAAIVTGWGAKCYGCAPISEILQRVDINIVGRELCGSDRYKHRTAIKQNMICANAGNKDSCQNDSGGPLVCNGQLVGVVSFGTDGCGDPNYPGVYTDVTKFRDWIDRNTAELKAL